MFIKKNAQKDLIISSRKAYFIVLILLMVLVCILIVINVYLHIKRYKVLQKKLIINDFFRFLDELTSQKPSLNIKMLSRSEINNDLIPKIDMYASNLLLMLPYTDICNSLQDLYVLIKNLIDKKHIVFSGLIVDEKNLEIATRHIIWTILLYKSNKSIYNFFILKN